MRERLKELQQRLAEIEATDEDDIPLGKAVARREATVQLAVEAADDLILEGSDGSAEETNLITGEVALKLLEKAVIPLRAAALKRELFGRVLIREQEKP